MNNPIFGLLGNLSNGANSVTPVMQLLSAINRGQNPIAALASLNPQIAQQLQGKTPQEIEQLVRNEYAKRGIDINSAMQQIQQLLQMKNF